MWFKLNRIYKRFILFTETGQAYYKSTVMGGN